MFYFGSSYKTAWEHRGAKHSPLTAGFEKFWFLIFTMTVAHVCNLVRSTLPWRPDLKKFENFRQQYYSTRLQFIINVSISNLEKSAGNPKRFDMSTFRLAILEIKNMVRSTLPWQPKTKNFENSRQQYYSLHLQFINDVLFCKVENFWQNLLWFDMSSFRSCKFQLKSGAKHSPLTARFQIFWLLKMTVL